MGKTDSLDHYVALWIIIKRHNEESKDKSHTDSIRNICNQQRVIIQSMKERFQSDMEKISSPMEKWAKDTQRHL